MKGFDKDTNVVKVKVENQKQFFKVWLSLIKSFHTLSNKEMDVASLFLYHRHLLESSISDESILNMVLMSSESKKKIADELEMNMPYFYVVIDNLRKQGFFNGDVVNKKFIPKLQGDSFKLLFLVDAKTDK